MNAVIKVERDCAVTMAICSVHPSSVKRRIFSPRVVLSTWIWILRWIPLSLEGVISFNFKRSVLDLAGVHLLALHKDHRVVVADRALEQPFCVVRVGWNNHF